MPMDADLLTLEQALSFLCIIDGVEGYMKDGTVADCCTGKTSKVDTRFG